MNVGAPVEGGARWTRRLALMAPLALATVAYLRTLHGEFQLDDLDGIVGNEAVKGLGAFLRCYTQPQHLLAGRPLTYLTFAANYAVGRLDPFGYHLVNVALHLAVVLLVGLLVRRVASLAGAERPERIALGVAGIFAVHPLQSEAVSYVSQRAELLSSALYVGTLLLLVCGAADARPRSRWALGAALGTFVLGFAAKPILVTVPLALLAIELAAEPRAAGDGPGRWRRALAPTAALAVAGLALGAGFLFFLRGRPDAGFSVGGTGPWLYFLTQLRACVVYLRLLAWPAGLRVDWAFETSPGLSDPGTIGAAVAILAVGAGAVLLLVRGRRTPGPDGAASRLCGLGIAWFFILLAPTSSFIPIADPLVERRVYLASLGVFLAVVAAVDAWTSRRGARRLAAVAWVAVLLALAAALHQRNAVWETKEALWRDGVAKSPGSALAHLSLGFALEERGRLEEAIVEYERARGLTRGNLAQEGKILRALGGAQLAAGRVEEARGALEAALHFLPRDDGLLASLALAAGASGDAAGAERYARGALAVNPARANAWTALGGVALEAGDAASALSSFGEATAIDPDDGAAQYGRALALRALGREGDECAALREALRAGLRPAHEATVRAELAARCR